eukprot:gene7532-11856_t
MQKKSEEQVYQQLLYHLAKNKDKEWLIAEFCDHVQNEKQFNQLFDKATEEYHKNPDIGLYEKFGEIIHNQMNSNDHSSSLNDPSIEETYKEKVSAMKKQKKSPSSTPKKSLTPTSTSKRILNFNSSEDCYVNLYRQLLEILIKSHYSDKEPTEELESLVNEIHSLETIKKMYESAMLKMLLLMKFYFSYGDIEFLLEDEFKKIDWKGMMEYVEKNFKEEFQEHKLYVLRSKYASKISLPQFDLMGNDDIIENKSTISSSHDYDVYDLDIISSPESLIGVTIPFKMKNDPNGNPYYQIYSKGELNSTFKDHFFLQKNLMPYHEFPLFIQVMVHTVKLQSRGGENFGLERKSKYYIVG